MRNFLCVVAMVGLLEFASGQEQQTNIKHGSAATTSPASGKEMFVAYCASCHGKDAKGDGPAASALKIAPADLTALASKNGGKYPAARVTTVLTGQADLAAHGNKDMPVWGPIFFRMSQGHESEVQMRIANLNHYIESLQVK